MRCDHRFELVGYRHRRPGENTDSGHGFSFMDAVLVCSKCTAEHLAGVTQMPPAPIIETRRRHSGRANQSEPVFPGDVYGHCGICGVSLDYHCHIQRELDDGRITKVQAGDCRARHHKPGCSHAMTPFWRDARC